VRQARSLSQIFNRKSIFVIDSLLASHVECSYLNTDRYKFESSQKDESRTQSADSSKTYRKARAFNCCVFTQISLSSLPITVAGRRYPLDPNFRQSQLYAFALDHKHSRIATYCGRLGFFTSPTCCSFLSNSIKIGVHHTRPSSA